MPSFIGDVVSGVGDAIGGVVGGVVDAVGSVAKVIKPITAIASLVPGPWQLPALAFNTVNSVANGNILGAVTGAFGLSNIAGAAGGVMSADQMQAAMNAYTSAGYTADQAAGFIGQAAGVSDMTASTLGNMIQGGGTLQMAAQAPFQAAGSSLGSISNIIKAGSGIYSAMNMNAPQSASSAQQAADPYSQYRQQSADQLNKLLSNPSMVYGMPGYNFAQQEAAKNIQRLSAATGTSISGGTLNALQKNSAEVAQNWFDKYVNTLGSISGATNPTSAAAGADAYTSAQTARNQYESEKQRQILQSMQGLATSFYG